MRWSNIPFDPTRKTLRQFAVLWIVFFSALAVWEYGLRDRLTVAIVCGILAVTLGPIGLARPEWLRPVYVTWMVLAFPIGWTVSQLLLGMIFYGLFTPIGLLFRLIGRDPLHRVARKVQETYWEPKPSSSDLRRYFQQF
jgi:hypothetical protein